MGKTLTEEQQRLLERVRQVKEQQAKQPQAWTAGAGKVKRAQGANIAPHVPQKKP
jgi:hypothetical protein